MTIRILDLDDAHRPWARSLIIGRWGSTTIVTRGQAYAADALPGLVAILDGAPCGLLTYRLTESACEIVSLDSLAENRGIGTALLSRLSDLVQAQGSKRIWLITTNDNTHALRFYQRRGFRLVALHVGAITRSRQLKPEIPMTGIDGIPITDEIELELDGPCGT
jgi:GNAT superfamily N-acetyltransferase